MLDRAFLPGETAVMVPKTDDGRVLFAIPWHDRVVDRHDRHARRPASPPSPGRRAEEVDFLLAARRPLPDPRPRARATS